MLEFLKKEMTDITKMERFIRIGLTDVLAGNYVDFDADQILANLINILYASFSYAGYFPPVKAMDKEWFSGETVWDLDIFSGVNECLKTHQASDIVVDVVMTSDKTLQQVDASDYSALKMLWRYLKISKYYSNMDGLLRAKFAYPNVNFRYIISPTTPLPNNWFPLNMSKDEVTQTLNQGEVDGKNAKESGIADAEDTLHFFSLKKKQDLSVENMDFASFKDRKASGEFAEFDLLQDKHLQSLFLQ